MAPALDENKGSSSRGFGYLSTSSGERNSSPYTTESAWPPEIDFRSEGPASKFFVAVSIVNLSGDGAGVTTGGAAEAGPSTGGTGAEACTGGG